MPPRRYKVNHHKDKGSSFAGFLDRNAEVLPDHMLKKKKQPVHNDSDSESESEDSVVEAPKSQPRANQAPKVKEGGNSSDSDDVDSELAKQFGRPGGPVGESRKEREQRQAEEAKKRYQELHLAGKTTEAKADLARLAEIRRKREEAAANAQKLKEEKDAARLRGRRPVNPNADVAREAFM